MRGRLVQQTAAAERSLALDPTVNVLRRWRARQAAERLAAGPAWTDTGLVFTRVDGTGHRPNQLSSTFTSQVDRLGLPRIGFDGLCHSYASAALRSGVSPKSSRGDWVTRRS